MRAGRLRHKATLQAQSETKDGFNQRLTTWSDLGAVWCAIEPLRGSELIAAQRELSEVTHKIIMRYRADVSAANRLSFNGRLFNLGTPINRDERNRELEFLASEIRTSG